LDADCPSWQAVFRNPATASPSKTLDTFIAPFFTGNCLPFTSTTPSLTLEILLNRSKSSITTSPFPRSGIRPRDIDVVELHDVYTINGVLLLEDLGFSEKGQAARDLAEGRFRVGDKPSVNPSGGLKARGHPTGATGVYQAAEVFLQLIGSFKGRRLDNAERGLVLSMGDVGESAVALVFAREA